MRDPTLPLGCKIIYNPGRNQPYTVYIGGNTTYNPTSERFVWQFCHMLGEAQRFIERVIDWRPNGVAPVAGMR